MLLCTSHAFSYKFSFLQHIESCIALCAYMLLHYFGVSNDIHAATDFASLAPGVCCWHHCCWTAVGLPLLTRMDLPLGV
uniref:Uncharacterized protein n=1 Tax=Aegilops tauschii subsp. strangulata TaxID=200361 RepID=A0A453FKF2_AEGTS